MDLAERGLGEGDGLADHGIARAAVGVGDDDEVLAGERVVLRHAHPAAAGEEPAGRPAGAAQADAVGIGQRGLLGEGQAAPRPCPAAESFRLLPDARDGAPCDAVFLRAGESAEPQREIGAAASQDVAVRQQSGELGGLRPGQFQHVGETGMERQRGEAAAVICDPAVLERTEARKERLRLGERTLGRRGQERQAGPVGRAPEGELEGEAGEVGGLDLRRRPGGKRAVLAPRPELPGGAGSDAAGAAGALGGLGAGDAFGDQPGHAGAGIEAGAAGAAAVDDDPHVLDGERGLGDGGGEDELAPRAGADRRLLRGEGHGAVERADVETGQVETGRDAPDLALAGEEGQKAALLRGGGAGDQFGHRVVEAAARGERTVEPARLDRMGAAFAGDDGRTAEQRRDRLRVEGGGHDDEGEVGTQRGADLERQREAQIGVERALVELVEDHAADAVELGVGLQAAGEDAFGDDLDAGLR